MHMHMHMMMHMQVEAKLMHMGQKSKRITDEEMGKRQPYGFGLGRYKYKYKNTQINFCDSPKYSLLPIALLGQILINFSGKRSAPSYDFGLGKRDLNNYDPEPAKMKRQSWLRKRFSLGFGKRAPYGFGLGK